MQNSRDNNLKIQLRILDYTGYTKGSNSLSPGAKRGLEYLSSKVEARRKEELKNAIMDEAQNVIGQMGCEQAPWSINASFPVYEYLNESQQKIARRAANRITDQIIYDRAVEKALSQMGAISGTNVLARLTQGVNNECRKYGLIILEPALIALGATIGASMGIESLTVSCAALAITVFPAIVPAVSKVLPGRATAVKLAMLCAGIYSVGLEGAQHLVQSSPLFWILLPLAFRATQQSAHSWSETINDVSGCFHGIANSSALASGIITLNPVIGIMSSLAMDVIGSAMAMTLPISERSVNSPVLSR